MPRSTLKFLVAVAAVVVLYNECFCHYFQKYFKWPLLDCSTSSSCLKILLVADPQLLGEQLESGFLIGSVARWDNDRYLTKTFKQAFSHVEPHLVIFLGDLMDEGSIAKNEEYQRYMQRFLDIFAVHFKTTVAVYLPGDNDIGGENEPLTRESLQRYDHYFHQPDIIKYKALDIYKVNRLTQTMPPAVNFSFFEALNTTRVVVSHLPLTFMPSPFVSKVLSRFRPHVIFSAHIHKAIHTSLDTLTGQEIKTRSFSAESDEVYKYLLSERTVHEIMVPTCSYRMGVRDTGYGVALIDTNQMLYAVLWLPHRFTQLYILAAVLTIGLSVELIRTFICCCRHGYLASFRDSVVQKLHVV